VRLDIKLLGPLEATLDNVRVTPSAAKIRQLLTLLALSTGHVVPVSACVNEIWGQDPPRTALTTLHTYIGKLRKGLDAAITLGTERHAKKIIATESNGYRMDASIVRLDLDRYEELASAGRQAAEDGDYLTASHRLTAALSLWRGPALCDVTTGPQLTIESVRLAETRLSDLDTRLEADLRLGRGRGLLGELAGLCAQYPLSESLCAKYMLALYRTGQQWRALEAFHQLRTRTVEELGVDPTSGIRRLHEAVLRGDPALDRPEPYGSDRMVAHAIAG
jgi:DNA-binding SARP family transcriptional activator